MQMSRAADVKQAGAGGGGDGSGARRGPTTLADILMSGATIKSEPFTPKATGGIGSGGGGGGGQKATQQNAPWRYRLVYPRYPPASDAPTAPAAGAAAGVAAAASGIDYDVKNRDAVPGRNLAEEKLIRFLFRVLGRRTLDPEGVPWRNKFASLSDQQRVAPDMSNLGTVIDYYGEGGLASGVMRGMSALRTAEQFRKITLQQLIDDDPEDPATMTLAAYEMIASYVAMELAPSDGMGAALAAARASGNARGAGGRAPAFYSLGRPLRMSAEEFRYHVGRVTSFASMFRRGTCGQHWTLPRGFVLTSRLSDK